MGRILDPIDRRWPGELVVVAGTGPSLTPETAALCKGHKCIAVNDAYKLLPFADVLYAADYKWWEVHGGCPDFKGEKIMPDLRVQRHGPGERVAKRYGLRVIAGAKRETFSLDPSHINYGVHGANGGLQATNLALLFGGNPIVLVGFDMKAHGKKVHFFGQHPRPLMQHQYFGGWIDNMKKAARALSPDITIINATPGSALRCFPIMSPEDALRWA